MNTTQGLNAILESKSKLLRETEIVSIISGVFWINKTNKSSCCGDGIWYSAYLFITASLFGLVCIKKKASVLEMKYTFNKRRRVISVTKTGIFFS